MSLDIIKNLQEKVENLETRVSKESEERRNKVIVEKQDTPETLKELQTRGANAYLFQRITGKELSDKVIATRAINPTDLPNWLAEQFKNDLVERMTLLANVEGLFPKLTIPENVETLSIPKKKGALRAYLIAPSQDAINSAIASDKVSFKAKALMTLTATADQTNDEVILATMEILKNDIAESLVDAMENAIINGDTTAGDGNINGSTIGNDNNDQLKVFKGIRKITEERDASGLSSKLDFGGTINLEKLVSMRALMGKESVKTSDLVYVVSPITYHKLLRPSVLPEMLTVDKYGAKATVITGEVAKIEGIPVLVSEFVPTNLDATGKYADDGDKTVILLINKKMFSVASRGAAVFEADRNIVNRTNILTGFRDVDFQSLTEGLGVVSSVIGYNIDA